MLSSRQRAVLAAADCAVRFDNLTRQLYATDASLYQIEPAAVAFPETALEASALVRAAAEAGVAVIPRGAGSGLVGGALGEGVVVDFARHHRRILAFDREALAVRVGAGVVLDQLNAFLKPHGLCFGPDVATSSRATLGGMIANNSSGARAPLYGTTADHVLSLEVVLADGRIVTLGREPDGPPSLVREVQDLVVRLQEGIVERLPAGLLKRWPGYGLDRFLRKRASLTEILAGSEGTLAAITEAELRLVPLPREKGLGLVCFDSVPEALQAAVTLLDLKPVAIEHVDRVLFDQTRGQLQFQAARDLLELDARPCGAFLLVEFYEDVAERLATLAQRRLGLRTTALREARAMELVWGLRRAGLSLLTGCAGLAKPVTGIEDAAVLPGRLPAYVEGVQRILGRLGLRACFYGHAAAGLLHVRPVLDLHRAEDLRKFRQVCDEVSALVRQFKGSLCAEHGVGVARTEYLREHLGEELLGGMRDIKRAFDPGNLFNPGKILGDFEPTSSRAAGEPAARTIPDYRIDTRLRLGAGRELELPFAPALAFAAKDGSFVGNLEQCNGCGGCRKETPVMCPTFLATGEEWLSTRGRANLIRAALEGRGLEGADPLTSAELEAALSHCLSCKACATECPSNVNLALLKAELLHARHRRDGVPLRAWLLSRVDLLGNLGCLAPGLANAALNWPWLRARLARTLGISPRRPLPAYADERFDLWFARRNSSPAGCRGEVILWDDTFVRYHEPHIGRAAVAVLEAAGFKVRLAQGRRCCGRPAFSQGDLDRAGRLGRHNLALLNALADHTRAPAPIVFLEPACWAMFVEDYRELKLPGAKTVAGRCVLFEQFVEGLLNREPDVLRFAPGSRPVAIHAHCHARALTNPEFMVSLAARLPGSQVSLLPTACCGMAGAFGALESQYALSVRVGGMLAETIRRQPADTVIVASGTSCRQQIEHLTPVRPKHMAELLAEALASGPRQA